jgi:polysaccharide pyruvyl transferase WcaK-like protein
MKLGFVGWYGTKTIGDRAIMAGIFKFLTEKFGTFEAHIGSLEPFFSERTLEHDKEFFEILGIDQPIKLYNAKKPKQLEELIRITDALFMGGGPLMDLASIYIIEYAFKYAKKKKKTTIIYGCGVGPLKNSKFQKSVVNIFKYADYAFLRDVNSLVLIQELTQYNNQISSKCVVAIDPAVECVLQYQKYYQPQPTDDNLIVINLRSFPREYPGLGELVNQSLEDLVHKIATQYPNKKVLLVPMHYFHIGDDDRYVLNHIAQKFSDLTNIEVQNTPLNLVDTLKVFEKAYFTIGMRFHSVVLQTLLNGRNYILDYTSAGKTLGFIERIKAKDLYKDRMVDLRKPADISDLNFKTLPQQFKANKEMLNTILDSYQQFEIK